MREIHSLTPSPSPEGRGELVLRLPNHQMLHHPDRVLDQIQRHLSGA
jgi:very-short-patch-repair endonuclease